MEIKCASGQTVTATFTKDCRDREVMAWHVWEGKGLPGEPVHERLIEAVERRFGSVDAVPDAHALELLSDNGGAYIAAETKALARSLGLKPSTRPFIPILTTLGRTVVDRMNRTVKGSTIKANKYEGLEQPREQIQTLVQSYSFRKNLKAFKRKRPFLAMRNILQPL